jgi:thioesterase domain-containing protein
VLGQAARPLVRSVDVSTDDDIPSLLARESSAPFDLAIGPLCRVVVIRRGPAHHLLLAVLHHIVADNASLGLFMAELSRFYAALCRRTLPSFPAPAWQFRDFATAESHWLASQAARRRLQRYAAVLRGASGNFDFGGPDPASPARSELVTLPPALNARLATQARRAGATPFAVQLACFAVAIAPFADEPDLIIAAPVAGRTTEEAEAMIGPFANLVGVRADLRRERPWADLVSEIGARLVEALDNQDLPWDEVVRELRPSRAAGAPALASVLFTSVRAAAPMERFGDQPCRPVGVAAAPPPFEISTSQLEMSDGGLFVQIDGRTDRVSTAALRSLADRFARELRSIAEADGNSPVLPMPRPKAKPVHDAGPAPAPVRSEALRAAPGSEHEPRDELERAIADLWTELLGQPPAHRREDFFEAGGHSLLAVRLTAALGARLGQRISVSVAFAQPTVAGMADALRHGGVNGAAVVRLAPGTSPRTLYIGGSHRGLLNLARAMQPGPGAVKFDVYALQEERMLAGEALLDSVEAIASEFIDRIRALQPEGPYYLAGGCEGGIVAFEMALQLQEAGESVPFLGQLDTPVTGYFVPNLKGAAKNVGRSLRDLALRAIEGPPEPVHNDTHGQLWGAIWTAVRNYRPSTRFQGDLHLFRAAPHPEIADVAQGWSDRISGEVRIHAVPGDHLGFITDPRSATILRIVMDEVEATRSAPAGDA